MPAARRRSRHPQHPRDFPGAWGQPSVLGPCGFRAPPPRRALSPTRCGKPRAHWARGFCLPLEIRKACLGGGLSLACRRCREAARLAWPVMRLKRRAQATSRRLAPAPWKGWEGPGGASSDARPWNAGPEGLLPGRAGLEPGGKASALFCPLRDAPARWSRGVEGRAGAFVRAEQRRPGLGS